MGLYSVDKLMVQARKLAAEYRAATGKPLGGISSEIAEFDAAHHMGLELTPGAGGYDAVGRSGDREGKKIQIKGRVLIPGKRNNQRIGQIKLGQDWDSLMLVLMNENYESMEIYEAERDVLEEAMDEESGNRTSRGAMSLAKFKNLAQLVWAEEEGQIDDEIWDNQAD